ncbi:hypothetical protein ACXO19_02475 [Lactobacillus delbrueckii subsp. bulgaricus]|nr:hypothetical protein [Lactobacillus delbrueckii subsp. bulgaricus]MBT8913537.1 hypothetical protein [Lactobacillus delbrueckii subsp. bulgaricus]MBT8917974.1 hypothetical protein [Lactobacillus delbrueckii subsp. bulgaricus]
MTSTASKNTKDHPVRRIILRLVAVILFLLGLALVFNQQISAFLVKQNQTAALKGLTRDQVVQNQKKKGMYDFKKVKSIDFAQTTRSRVKNTAGAIGAISIPSVKLYLPVMQGLSDAALSTGGGTMRVLITCADGGVNRWSLRGKLTAVKPASKQNLEMFKLR